MVGVILAKGEFQRACQSLIIAAAGEQSGMARGQRANFAVHRPHAQIVNQAPHDHAENEKHQAGDGGREQGDFEARRQGFHASGRTR